MTKLTARGVYTAFTPPWIVVFIFIGGYGQTPVVVNCKHDVSKMLDYLISDEPDEYDSIRYDKTLRPNFGGDSVPVSCMYFHYLHY